tara:strand:- start:386 stop:586 length:201 start_codon:yes stop_codon:yes gene_type:complete
MTPHGKFDRILVWVSHFGPMDRGLLERFVSTIREAAWESAENDDDLDSFFDRVAEALWDDEMEEDI